MERIREMIYQCNLELTDFMVTHTVCIIPQHVQEEKNEMISCEEK